jgi:hypothetical protein
MVMKWLLIEAFTMRREKIPAWRQRWDAMNLAIIGAVILFILWTTFRP